MKKRDLTKKPNIRMYLVVCGNSEFHKGEFTAHAALCFDHDVALAEKEQMKKLGYPVIGIFEINTLNIFNKNEALEG